MKTLFRIETDKVFLTWSLGRDKEPPFLLSVTAPDGRLRIEKRRKDLVFHKIYRDSLPDEIGIGVTLGPRLFEQIDYKLYLRLKTEGRVALVHRDPLICKDIDEEDSGQIVHGYVNFGSQVGRSLFSVLVDSQPELDFEVEVFPTKVDYYSDYEQMLAQVQQVLTGLALEFLRATVRPGIEIPVPQASHIEWLLLLSQIVDDLEVALRYIAQRPIRAVVRAAENRSVERVKRLDSSLRNSIRKQSSRAKYLQIQLGGENYLLQEKVRENRPSTTLDTFEHRWIAARLKQISQRLAMLRVEEQKKEQSIRRKQILQEIVKFESRITKLLLLEPLAAVTTVIEKNTPTLQLLTAPGYKEAYRAFQLLTLGLKVDGAVFKLSIKDLSLLYEYWAYLTVVTIVAEETGQKISASTLFSIKENGLQLLLQKGRETAISFKNNSREVVVTYNPLYQSDYLLVPQQPDILITFSDTNWPSLRFLLDAKYRIDSSIDYTNRYKTPGPPEDAINTLHRYRDAILELIPYNNSLITPNILDTETNVGREASSHMKIGDVEKSQELRVPKHVVVQAAALFPYDETCNKVDYPSFNESLLWKSLEKLGIGAIPFLPSNTSYLRSWIRTALRRGGWATADITLDHAARSRAQAWKIASSEIVMIGVLRNIDPEEHFSWIDSKQIYYTPLQKDQRRQLSVNSIAIYSPKSLQSKRSVGAVTHVAKVVSIEVKKRSEIVTPWQSRKGNDQLQIVYKLGKLITLDRPIENISGQRFSINRWSSRLALERAAILEELFLETEAEWRLYEALKVNKVDFKLVASKLDSNARTDFLLKNGSIVAYERTSGFLLKSRSQKTIYFVKLEDLLEQILETS